MDNALFADVLPPKVLVPHLVPACDETVNEPDYDTVSVADPSFKPLGPLRPVRWLLPHEAAGIIPQVVRAYAPPNSERIRPGIEERARRVRASQQARARRAGAPRQPRCDREQDLGPEFEVENLDREYKTGPKERTASSKRQAGLIKEGLCLNGRGHGKAVFGRRCEHCHWVWKFGYANALEKGLIVDRQRPKKNQPRNAVGNRFAAYTDPPAPMPKNENGEARRAG